MPEQERLRRVKNIAAGSILPSMADSVNLWSAREKNYLTRLIFTALLTIYSTLTIAADLAVK